MLFSVLWSTVLFTGHPRNPTNSSQLVLILKWDPDPKGPPWSTYPQLSVETEATASMVMFHLGNCLIHSFSQIHLQASLRIKAGHSWNIWDPYSTALFRSVPTDWALGSSSVSVWLMLFSSFSGTRPAGKIWGNATCLSRCLAALDILWKASGSGDSVQ